MRCHAAVIVGRLEARQKSLLQLLFSVQTKCHPRQETEYRSLRLRSRDAKAKVLDRRSLELDFVPESAPGIKSNTARNVCIPWVLYRRVARTGAFRLTTDPKPPSASFTSLGYSVHFRPSGNTSRNFFFRTTGTVVRVYVYMCACVCAQACGRVEMQREAWEMK